ncbi:MAG: glycosyltransferase [Spirochaetes bacterium]|nr:glycosyltransferase [Spirochaetota bacterium]
MISIFLPVWNGEPYLEACLRSIVAQTDEDWELLAVDDGSTDASAGILAHWAGADGRIRFLPSPHRGLLAALRRAEAEARGALFARMDQDDLMPPERLALQRALLEAEGPGVVATGRAEAYSEAGPVGPGFKRYVDWLSSLRTHGDHLAGAFLECIIASPSWMMRRDDFLSCGGHGAIEIPEDYGLALRWLAHGMRIAKTPETVLLWRDHPARATRTRPEYRDNRFWELKARSLRPVLGERLGGRRFAVWGMGDTGKSLARSLLVHGEVPACLVTDNPRKQGIVWEGVPVRGADFLDRRSHFVLSAVSARGGWEEISGALAGRGWREVEDYLRMA